jgi:alkanesulfonate monooxygenase SsuD/methylene tetrahydromethanopterin reductase-like flavin-dependent oxidoreductase (luciferase family)
MKIGMFIQPMMLPERTVKETHEWSLQCAVWADQYGFSDVYVGEHHTVKHEPIPCPDVLVTDILRATKDIRVGTAGFVLPFHHPAQLANRVAYLDHISEGRFNFGIASGSVPTDWGMFDIDGFSGQQREMTQESLNLIRKLWAAEKPEKFEGKYWTVAWPEPFSDALKPWLKPYQQPHPPISIAGATPGSSTLEFAGELGLNPMSIFLSQKLVETHWASYEKGCAKSGHAADRSKWIITREMIIADTDEEAWEIAKAGPAMRVYREYRLPMYAKVGWINNLKHNPQVPDEDVTIEYCLEHHWLIGSPETVANKIAAMYRGVGGFGELMCLNQDFIDNPEVWRRTLELFGKEVLPRIAQLSPSADAAGAVAA